MLTILHKDGKRYRIPEETATLAKDLYNSGVDACINYDSCIVVCEYHGAAVWSIDDPLNFNSYTLPPSEYTIVPEVKVREIEWRGPGGLHGYIGEQCVGSIIAYAHGTYEYPEKRFNLELFENEDWDSWHATKDEAKAFCQSQLNEFVKSMIEVK